MLKIVVPLAIIIVPVLCSLNYIHGRAEWELKNNQSVTVTGLDKFAFGNVAPNLTNRYWAHLVLSILTAVWTCFIFFKELRYYIGVRQEYLTSPQHRLRGKCCPLYRVELRRQGSFLQCLLILLTATQVHSLLAPKIYTNCADSICNNSFDFFHTR